MGLKRNHRPCRCVRLLTRVQELRVDRLGASLRAFLAAVRGEADRPAVTGEEAARALDLALAVEQAAGG